MHLTNSFLNPVLSTEFRTIMGWCLIGVAGLNIAFNIVLVGYNTLLDIILQVYGWFLSY